jgi:hypothetical protein
MYKNTSTPYFWEGNAPLVITYNPSLAGTTSNMVSMVNEIYLKEKFGRPYSNLFARFLAG